MAYTAAPETQTYGPVRIPAAYDIDMRYGAQYAAMTQYDTDSPNYPKPTSRIDAGMLNMLFKEVESVGKDQKQATEYYAESRPPVVARSIVSTTNYPTGMYVWEPTAGNRRIFVSIGDKLYYGVGAGGLFSEPSWSVLISGISGGAGVTGFTEFIDASNNKSLVFVDGTSGWVITVATATTVTATQITDVDFPSPHWPYPIYLDGYLFLAKYQTGDIYNSDLNNPASWTAGNFISTEIYPDDAMALHKINNYLVAIGSRGTEFFYDAGIASGSPLARYDGGVVPAGTYFPATVSGNNDTVVFLSNMQDGEPVLTVIKDFKSKQIPCAWLSNYLTEYFAGLYTFTGGSGIKGCFFRMMGKNYYLLNLDTNTSATPGTFYQSNSGTFVYCLEQDKWVEFSSGNDPLDIKCIYTAQTDRAVPWITGYYRLGEFVYFGTLGPYGQVVPFFTTFGLDYFNAATTTVPITCQIRTPAFDFGTMNRKFLYRLTPNMVVDNQAESYSIKVEWADGDYQYNNSRTSTITYDFPAITQLGSFRRRSFRFTFDGPYSYKVNFFELDLNRGQQ